MDIKSKYKDVLLDLFYSEKGLLAFTLYGRYAISPSEIIGFINEYRNQGYLQVNNEHRISLTDLGRKELNSLLQALPHENVNTSVFLQSIRTYPCKDIFEPYLPDELFYIKNFKGKRVKETSI